MREMKAEYTGGLHSSLTDARNTMRASLSCPPDLPAADASLLRTLDAAMPGAVFDADASVGDSGC